MKTLMKTMIALALCISLFGINISRSDAGSFSITGSSTVSPSGTTTVSISATGVMGEFGITVSGATITATSSSASTTMNGTTGAILFLDNSSVTLTLKAGSSGSITVTAVSKDLVTDDLVAENLGTKTKTITIVQPSTDSDSSNSGSSSSGSSSSSTTTTTTKSSNNKLGSLSIEGVELSPDFEGSVVTYKGSVIDVDKITIKASADHEDASVSGTGEKELKLGNNEFKVVCTAENGSTKTYIVTIFKDESPSLFVEIEDGPTYGVVKYYEEASIPSGFEETTVRIDGEQVVAWKNTTLGITIVYLVDEEGKCDLYGYDEDAGTVSTFTPVAILGINLYAIEIEEIEKSGLIYQEVVVDGTTLMGWAFEDEAFANYYAIELMNEDGNMVTYLYDIVSNTMILYPTDMHPISEKNYSEELALVAKEDDTNFMIASGIAVATTASTAGLGVLYYLKFKRIAG